MILNKKKYKKTEVESLINAEIVEYEGKINALKERIQELISENASLKGELLVYKDKDAEISSALKNAQIKAQEIEKRAEKRYSAEIIALKAFSDKWKGYFTYLNQKYPMYPAVSEAKALYDEIEKCVLGEMISKDVVFYVDKLLNEKKVKINEGVFNPKGKINEYISETSENGFNLDDVLNPGELDLGDLCKELGLTEE